MHVQNTGLLEEVSEISCRQEPSIHKKLSVHNKLFLIFAIALVIRFIVSLCVVGDLTNATREHWGFGYETGRIARSVATGHGFGNPLFAPSGPSAWIAPVYPLLLAGLFKIFGVYSTASAVMILFFNSLVTALTCIPIFFITQKIFDRRTAFASSWVWAFFPYDIYLAANWVWDVSLTTFLLTAVLWLTLELEETKSIRLWVGYGLLWGLAALTNPTVLAAFPFLVLWICYRRHISGQSWIPRAVLFSATFAITISPWLVRNYMVFHQPIFLKDNFWLEVVVGNSEGQSHWWDDNAHPSRNMGELREMVLQGEVGYMAEKKQQALDFLSHHFFTYLLLCFRRFIYIWFGFWSFRLEYLVEEPFDPINMIFCSALSIAAFAGIRRAIRTHHTALIPCISCLLSIPIVHYFTHPFVSYRHPIDPEIVIFATYAVLPAIALSWARSRERAWLRRWLWSPGFQGVPQLINAVFSILSRDSLSAKSETRMQSYTKKQMRIPVETSATGHAPVDNTD